MLGIMGGISSQPPVVLDNARVLAYALVDDSVGYTGKSAVYVDRRVIGRVPRVAICQDLNSRELLLFHCDAKWTTLCVSGRFGSLGEAKQLVERTYPGIGRKWVDTNVSLEDAEAVLSDAWSEMRCSFCGRLPQQVDSLVEGREGRICDLCIVEFSGWLLEGTQDDA